MSDQAEFHRARAVQELAQAERAADRQAAKLHRELAKFHERAAAGAERSQLRAATDAYSIETDGAVLKV